MAIECGIAVMFDAGLDQCGSVEVAMEDSPEALTGRWLKGCDQPPALVWLGRVGLCEDHVLRMWPELAVPD
jgi:hypothetical protein